jgi:hypothetical protein
MHRPFFLTNFYRGVVIISTVDRALMQLFTKGGLISEDILTLVSLPIKGARSLPEQKISMSCLVFWAGNSNCLLRGNFFCQETKVKIPSEIKLPLLQMYVTYYVPQSRKLTRTT